MKLLKFITVLLLFTSSIYSQEKDITSFCEQEIKELDSRFVELEEDYVNVTKELDSLIEELKTQISDELQASIKEKGLLKQEHYDGLTEVVTRYRHFEAICDLPPERLKELFDHPNMVDFEEGKEVVVEAEEEEEDNNVYLYYGEDKVISEKILTKNNRETEILKQLIRDKANENYLGDVTIPKDGEEFFFYRYIKKKDEADEVDAGDKDDEEDEEDKADEEDAEDEGNEGDEGEEKDKADEADKSDKKEKNKKEFTQDPNTTYKFKKVQVEISEGVFSDIRAIVETPDGNTHIFENQVGVSILRFSSPGKRNFLSYKHSIKRGSKSDKYNDIRLQDLFIKLSDVFVYDYKLGNHYAPSDLVLELPIQDAEGNSTNKNGFATYKIKEESHIAGIVELRTYTDFLALFGESENGLVQIEGKADFYVAPFPMAWFGNSNLFEVKFFNKISPKVNYSRFDEDTRYVKPVYDPVSMDSIIGKELDLVEKRFLTMGIDASLIKFNRKGVPFSLDLMGTFNYQLTELNYQDNINNVKAVSYGPIASFQFKKFNNFGLNYSLSFLWYDYINFNEDLDILPEKFRVFSNEIEVFYFPTGNKNQSIFVRLRTFNNSEPKNNEAFYQFQFGYRFAIGAKSIKKS